MAFYSHQLLTNPAFKLFWKTSALGSSGASVRRGPGREEEGPEGHDVQVSPHISGLAGIKRQDALHGEAQIAQACDLLTGFLQGQLALASPPAPASLPGAHRHAGQQGASRRAKAGGSTLVPTTSATTSHSHGAGPLGAEGGSGLDLAPALVLRVPSQLLLGMVRLHAHSIQLLLQDCGHALLSLNKVSSNIHGVGAYSKSPSAADARGARGHKRSHTGAELAQDHAHEEAITRPDPDDWGALEFGVLTAFWPSPLGRSPSGFASGATSRLGLSFSKAGGQPDQGDGLLQPVPLLQSLLPAPPAGWQQRAGAADYLHEDDEVFEEGDATAFDLTLGEALGVVHQHSGQPVSSLHQRLGSEDRAVQQHGKLQGAVGLEVECGARAAGGHGGKSYTIAGELSQLTGRLGSFDFPQSSPSKRAHPHTGPDSPSAPIKDVSPGARAATREGRLQPRVLDFDGLQGLDVGWDLSHEQAPRASGGLPVLPPPGSAAGVELGMAEVEEKEEELQEEAADVMQAVPELSSGAPTVVSSQFHTGAVDEAQPSGAQALKGAAATTAAGAADVAEEGFEMGLPTSDGVDGGLQYIHLQQQVPAGAGAAHNQQHKLFAPVRMLAGLLPLRKLQLDKHVDRSRESTLVNHQEYRTWVQTSGDLLRCPPPFTTHDSMRQALDSLPFRAAAVLSDTHVAGVAPPHVQPHTAHVPQPAQGMTPRPTSGPAFKRNPHVRASVYRASHSATQHPLSPGLLLHVPGLDAHTARALSAAQQLGGRSSIPVSDTLTAMYRMPLDPVFAWEHGHALLPAFFPAPAQPVGEEEVVGTAAPQQRKQASHQAGVELQEGRAAPAAVMGSEEEEEVHGNTDFGHDGLQGARLGVEGPWLAHQLPAYSGVLQGTSVFQATLGVQGDEGEGLQAVPHMHYDDDDAGAHVLIAPEVDATTTAAQGHRAAAVAVASVAVGGFPTAGTVATAVVLGRVQGVSPTRGVADAPAGPGDHKLNGGGMEDDQFGLEGEVEAGAEGAAGQPPQLHVAPLDVHSRAGSSGSLMAGAAPGAWEENADGSEPAGDAHGRRRMRVQLLPLQTQRRAAALVRAFRRACVSDGETHAGARDDHTRAAAGAVDGIGASARGLPLSYLAQGLSRQAAARAFWDLMALHTHGLVEMHQAHGYGDIWVVPTPALLAQHV